MKAYTSLILLAYKVHLYSALFRSYHTTDTQKNVTEFSVELYFA